MRCYIGYRTGDRCDLSCLAERHPKGYELRPLIEKIEVGSTSPLIADIGPGYLFCYENYRINLNNNAKNHSPQIVENNHRNVAEPCARSALV